MPEDLRAARQAIRRRTFANLLLGLRAEAARTEGRLVVRPWLPDTLQLVYRDVRTLVRRGAFLERASRDFELLLVCPRLWPFAREEALQPFVLAPADFAHPNSDGRLFCLDLRGVMPDRLPTVLYDNLRVHAHRLDSVVDHATADFVRARRDEFPADTRALYPGGEGF